MSLRDEGDLHLGFLCVVVVEDNSFFAFLSCSQPLVQCFLFFVSFLPTYNGIPFNEWGLELNFHFGSLIRGCNKANLQAVFEF